MGTYLHTPVQSPAHVPRQAPNSAALCLACGLCCNGALHHHASIKPSDITLIRELGLTLSASEGQLGFELPCPLYLNGCCSVYPRRPSICAEYQCKLLKQHNSGEIDLAQALEVVQTAKALFEKIVELIPHGYALADLRRDIEQRWNSGQGVAGSVALRRANSALLINIGRLAYYLRKHFQISLEKHV